MCKIFYVFYLFLLFFVRPSSSAIVNSINEADTKNVVKFNSLDSNISQSDYYEVDNNDRLLEEKGLEIDTSVGRTFGRPLKKMMQALIPLAFQLGASSTWMAVAAIVGFKTLLVSLAILKILLLAGALKVGALFAHKSHGHDHGWQPSLQKEVHVHIHGQHGHHEEVSPAWNRDGATDTSTNTNSINYVASPYAAGPHTINTPYGNYVRLDSLQNNNQILSNLNT